MNFDYLKDIEYFKTALGINNNELQEIIGISRMTLNRWQNNKVVPNYDSLEKIYNKFHDSGVNINRIKEEMYKSLEKKNHIVLFHGAKQELIGEPSIEFSETKKDFGKGFYLGDNFNQSASFVIGYPNSSIYIFDFDISKAKIKKFNVSEEWMILIAYFRGRLNEYEKSKTVKSLVDDLKKYDVVIAPIADNTMYTILDDFISGNITNLQCLNALSANRLGMQYVFLNDKIIKNNLQMLEKCFYCQNERNEYQEYRLKENSIGKNKVKIALREYAGKGKYIEELL